MMCDRFLHDIRVFIWSGLEEKRSMCEVCAINTITQAYLSDGKYKRIYNATYVFI